MWDGGARKCSMHQLRVYARKRAAISPMHKWYLKIKNTSQTFNRAFRVSHLWLMWQRPLLSKAWTSTRISLILVYLFPFSIFNLNIYFSYFNILFRIFLFFLLFYYYFKFFVFLFAVVLIFLSNFYSGLDYRIFSLTFFISYFQT